MIEKLFSVPIFVLGRFLTLEIFSTFPLLEKFDSELFKLPRETFDGSGLDCENILYILYMPVAHFLTRSVQGP